MILSFKSQQTEKLFKDRVSTKDISNEMAEKAMRILSIIDSAFETKDLEVFGKNRLTKVIGSGEFDYSISIGNSLKINFQFKDGDASNLELITAGHGSSPSIPVKNEELLTKKSENKNRENLSALPPPPTISGNDDWKVW